MKTALVIGAGPAGLMAAEVLSGAGLRVTIADQMPSPARKFLMAGKSGLNLAHATGGVAPFGDMPPALGKALSDFGAADVRNWAEGLGQSTFTGSSGRIFPEAMKASPLLRAWLARLDAQGVTLNRRWRWTGWAGPKANFDTSDGPQILTPDVTILALGGASWARLGSDGTWTTRFDDVAPFKPANCGFQVNWSDHMAPHIGKPIKNIRLAAGDLTSQGEIVLSDRGLEGGGIYEVSAAVRDGAKLIIDLLPDIPLHLLRARMKKRRAKDSWTTSLKKTARLSPEKIALYQEFSRNVVLTLPNGPADRIKSLPIRHSGPRPMDEAISTAGGLKFDAVDDHLMLKTRPGTFAAGEMLDWEAPTGGYLITACLATGRHAAQGALHWLGTAP